MSEQLQEENKGRPMDIEWGEGFELVLKKEAEQAEALFWLHNKAATLTAKRNDYIMIPAIVLQTVTGFLTATEGLVPTLVLGGISIFTGVLTTILSYFKFSARSEGHRVVAQLYMKIYKTVEVELALPPSQRSDPDKLFTDVREKIDRINEVAPIIPESIIQLYKKEFKHSDTSHPIIANGIDAISIYHKKDIPVYDIETGQTINVPIIEEKPKEQVNYVLENKKLVKELSEKNKAAKLMAKEI